MVGKIFAIMFAFLFTYPKAHSEINNTGHQFRYLTIENGLSHADANTIVQDKKGYIWIGTYSGLDRYDGYRVQSFYNEIDYINKSYLNRISDIVIDKNGMFWLATFSGIQLFDPFSEKFIPTEIVNENKRKGENEIKKIAIVKDNYLFAIDKMQKIVMYQIHNDYKLTSEPFSLNANCYSLFADKNGEIWFGTDQGLYRLTHDNKIQHIILPQLSDRVLFAYCDNNNLFAGNEEDLFFYPGIQRDIIETSHTINGGIPVRLNNDFGRVTDIRKSSPNDYWVSTFKGLYHLERNGATFNVLPFCAKDNPNELSSDYINELLVDKSQNLFIATYGGGVNILNLNQKSFHTLKRTPHTANTLSEKIVRAILEDGDFLWIGSNTAGLTRINQKNGKYDFFDTSDKNGLKSNEIRTLKQDKSNNIWIGHSKGINIIRPDRNGSVSFISKEDEPYFPETEVPDIAVDKFNQLWIGTWYNGICRIRKNKNGAWESEFFKQTKPDYPAFAPGRIITIYADPDRPEVFYSSGEQLIRIFLNEKGDVDKTLIYTGNNQRKNSLSSNFICSIERKNDSVLWIGSIGGGLSEMQLLPDGDYRAVNFSKQDGLNLKDVECMAKDNNGNLWLAGNELIKYDPATKQFRSYTTVSNSFKVGASYKSKNGTLYFGGINGLVFFNPNQIKESDIPAHPDIASLSINNKPAIIDEKGDHTVLKQNISNTYEIKLKHDRNNLTLYFTALNYADPASCEFRYRLKGYEKEKNTVSGRYPFAGYSNLPPGEYEFELEASNNDGIWSNETRTLKITVLSPWWLSLPAKIIYTILTLFLLIGIFYYLLRWFGLKKQLEIKDLKEKQKEQIHQMQLQFFTNISHEFRTPLTLISGVTEQIVEEHVGKKRNPKLDILRNNVNRLMRLINELMDFRKAETGSFRLNVQEKDIHSFVKTITDEFRNFADKKDLLFDVQIDNAIRKVWFDPHITEKIIMNLLNNSLKYTNEGGYVEVKILFDLKDHISPFKANYTIDSKFKAQSCFYLIVKDNGAGISKESIQKVFDRYYQIEDSEHDPHLGSGIGLALVKSLILLHKGKLTISGERNKGTEIIAAIPCSANDYSKNESAVHPDYIQPVVEKTASVENIVPANAVPAQLYNGKNLKSNILLVEDNDEIRNFLADMLSVEYEIREAVNGIDALNKMEKQLPDLIISDLMMPHMDGLKLCSTVKSDSEKNPIPFIMLTAKNTPDDEIIGINTGADAYLGKPVSSKLLTSTVRNLLSRQKKMKEHLSINYLSKTIEDTLQIKDKEFYDQLIQIIETHIGDFDLDVNLISKEMNCSRTKLYQKVKDTTGKAIMDLVRSVRLRKAVQIMAEEDISIQEIMQKVGIQSQSYFTSSFKKEFGKTPGQFVRDLKYG